ncbi:MAG: MFS transporter [Pseudomonadota bacterium]
MSTPPVSARSVPGRFAAIYAAQFLFLGVQLPFLTALLDDAGLSPTAIGAVMAGALIARLLFGPPLAAFADASGRTRRVQMGLGAGVCGGAALVGCGAYLLPGAPGGVVAGAGAVLALFAFGVVIPMTDAAAIAEEQAGRLRYGRVRAVGSAAFICANLGGGYLIARLGFEAGVFWLVLMGAGMALAASRLPRRGESATRPSSFAAARGLLRNRPFLLLVFAAGAGQAAHATYYGFSILHWTSLGYDAATVGALWATGVIAEIVLLANGRRLIARFAPSALIAIGGLAASGRWLATGLEPPLAALFCLQTLHALTFAAVHLGSVEAAGRLAPDARATAMTIISTFGVGALTGAATLVAGALFEQSGAFAAYALCAGLGAVAALAALVLMRMTVRPRAPAAARP